MCLYKLVLFQELQDQGTNASIPLAECMCESTLGQANYFALAICACRQANAILKIASKICGTTRCVLLLGI